MTKERGARALEATLLPEPVDLLQALYKTSFRRFCVRTRRDAHTKKVKVSCLWRMQPLSGE